MTPEIDEDELAMHLAERYSVSLNTARQIARHGLRSL